jgi:hypothetical protein
MVKVLQTQVVALTVHTTPPPLLVQSSRIQSSVAVGVMAEPVLKAPLAAVVDQLPEFQLLFPLTP